jgi:hypothetical protein
LDERRLDPRTVLHASIMIVLSLFYFWPGALLFNSTGSVMGLPSTAFFFVFAIPILNIANAVIWYRYMYQKDASFMAQEEKDKAA